MMKNKQFFLLLPTIIIGSGFIAAPALAAKQQPAHYAAKSKKTVIQPKAVEAQPAYYFYTPPAVLPTPTPVTQVSQTAPAITTVATNSASSKNWAGYSATTGSFTAVSGTWTIPNVPNNNTIAADATWVGIGGISSQDLIQTGTEAIQQSGQTVYQAWYELLPSGSVVVPLTVNPGDSISASITQQTPGQWNISLTDNTAQQNYQTTVQYNSSLSSAEWIEEMPSSNFGYLPLDNFGAMNFTNALTTQNGTSVNLRQVGAQPMAILDANNQPLANTSVIGPDGASFSVTRTTSGASTTTSIPGFDARGHWRRGEGITRGIRGMGVPDINYDPSSNSITVTLPFGFNFLRFGE